MSLKSQITNSPTAQAIISIFSIIIAGILVSAFITEINIDCGFLDWKHCYRAHAFWYLLGFAILIFVYYRFLYEFSPESVEDYKNKQYLQAKVTKECLPELIKKFKKDIRRDGVKAFNNIKKGLK